jgi:hypothetical protein
MLYHPHKLLVTDWPLSFAAAFDEVEHIVSPIFFKNSASSIVASLVSIRKLVAPQPAYFSSAAYSKSQPQVVLYWPENGRD